jgi:crossover junction endodeoxyribonuclease RuvC
VKILGVDTALRTTGSGIITDHGSTMTAGAWGGRRNKPKVPHSECLRFLGGGIRQLIDLYAPDIAVIEGAFYCRNVKTAMVLGMARGAAIAALADAGLSVYEYAPRKAKQVVVGHGAASKDVVAQVVASTLALDITDIPDDATDAMSLAMCHAILANTSGGVYLPAPI